MEGGNKSALHDLVFAVANPKTSLALYQGLLQWDVCG